MRSFVRNALVAALYASVALWLPSTAFANYRLTTALYVLAAWNPTLIPGLAVGNALAGLSNGFIDVVFGFVVGLLTAWVCSKVGKLAPFAVLAIPTLVVPLWLGWMFNVPYAAVVPMLLVGQTLSAVLGWALMRVPSLKRIVSD